IISNRRFVSHLLMLEIIWFYPIVFHSFLVADIDRSYIVIHPIAKEIILILNAVAFVEILDIPPHISGSALELATHISIYRVNYAKELHRNTKVVQFTGQNKRKNGSSGVTENIRERKGVRSGFSLTAAELAVKIGAWLGGRGALMQGMCITSSTARSGVQGSL